MPLPVHGEEGQVRLVEPAVVSDVPAIDIPGLAVKDGSVIPLLDLGGNPLHVLEGDLPVADQSGQRPA